MIQQWQLCFSEVPPIDTVGPDNTDELWRIPATGGEPSKLSLGFKVSHFVLHPDGERIAFTRGDPKAGIEVRKMENCLP